MNIKQSLLSTIILSMFVTGCSSNQINKSIQIKNEAIYQKTMTKVQNDVNEIMNKDYEYVINNMGEPYCITYYINSDEINNIDILNQNFKSKNMRLIYPKNTDKIQIEESAICIEIRNNIVDDVETYELSDLTNEDGNKDVDMVLKKHSNKTYLTNEIETDLSKYIGQDKSNIEAIVGDTSTNYEIYDNRNNTQINIYMLKGINKEDVRALGVCIYENKIKDIRVINKNNVNLIKNYLCK